MADSLPPSFQPKRKSIRSNGTGGGAGTSENAGVGAASNPEAAQPPSFAARRRPVINRENSLPGDFADEGLGSLARRSNARGTGGSAGGAGGGVGGRSNASYGASGASGGVSNGFAGSNRVGEAGGSTHAGVNGQSNQMPPAFAPVRRSVSGGVPTDSVPIDRPGNPVNPVAAVNSNNLNNLESAGNTGKQKKHVGAKRLIVGLLVLILVAVICWPVYLYNRANSQLARVDALSGALATSGTTYLFVGSDSREDSEQDDGVTGQRSDSIILVHKADNGQVAMVSLPRDTYVEIPGYGMNKINASFSFGGAELLVETVEDLTGLTVDHYVQIGMDGVGDIVDALGGVELCLDYDVSDKNSKLEWEAGCHLADGDTALAFSRMRYSDPLGDIGRAERQRQVLDAVSNKALSWSLLFSPSAQIALVDGGANTLTVDQETNVLDIAQLLLALKSAAASGLSGTPPIASIAYQTAAGSSVLLDESRVDDFFTKLANGTLTEEDFESIY